MKMKSCTSALEDALASLVCNFCNTSMASLPCVDRNSSFKNNGKVQSEYMMVSRKAIEIELIILPSQMDQNVDTMIQGETKLQ